MTPLAVMLDARARLLDAEQDTHAARRIRDEAAARRMTKPNRVLYLRAEAALMRAVDREQKARAQLIRLHIGQTA